MYRRFRTVLKVADERLRGTCIPASARMHQWLLVQVQSSTQEMTLMPSPELCPKLVSAGTCACDLWLIKLGITMSVKLSPAIAATSQLLLIMLKVTRKAASGCRLLPFALLSS